MNNVTIVVVGTSRRFNFVKHNFPKSLFVIIKVFIPYYEISALAILIYLDWNKKEIL